LPLADDRRSAHAERLESCSTVARAESRAPATTRSEALSLDDVRAPDVWGAATSTNYRLLPAAFCTAPTLAGQMHQDTASWTAGPPRSQLLAESGW